jgi:hypothetical protein
VLKPHVSEVLVCDPRKNDLGKDGGKVVCVTLHSEFPQVQLSNFQFIVLPPPANVSAALQFFVTLVSVPPGAP